MSIVDRIKQAAQEQKVSITAMEKQLSLSPKSIYRWDRSEPSISKVVAVANYLHVPLIWLATGSYSDFSSPAINGTCEVMNDENHTSLLERIKKAALNQGLTIKDVERQLGFSNGTIGKWAKSSPTIDRVMAVADLLHVSLLWLLNLEEKSSKNSNDFMKKYEMLSDIDKIKIDHFLQIALVDPSIPDKENFSNDQPYSDCVDRQTTTCGSPKQLLAVLGHVAAGKPIEGISTPLDYVIPPVHADYVLIANGYSMEPVIQSGEYIYVKNQSTLETGDIGIFYIDGDVTCKVYQPKSDCIVLRSLNPDFKPFKYSLNEHHDFKIQGKVVLTDEQKERFSK